jgi:glycerophosphoryl diester phosphodiesterase
MMPSSQRAQHTYTWEVTESFSISKRGTPDGGGDRVVNGSRYIGVVDAATEKFGTTLVLNGRQLTGEYAVAEVLSEQLTRANDDISGPLHRAQQELRAAAQLPEAEREGALFSLQAVFAVLDLQRSELLVLGDCCYGFKTDCGFQAFYNHKKIDTLASEVRAAFYLASGACGAKAVAGDPGRDLILDDLKQAARLANANPETIDDNQTLFGKSLRELVYPVFSASSCGAVHRILIPDRTHEVVIASDGYPEIFGTLEETERCLERSLREDPRRIEEHPATKGLTAGNASFDDRSYVRITLANHRR